MIDILLDTCLDILKTTPILLVVYAVLYVIEHKLRAAPKLLEKTQKLGPFVGAAAGCLPQCGFSAAAAALYQEGWLAPATLVAVFVATSDEAIPLLLAHPDAAKNVGLFLLIKLLLAVVGGYVLQWTLFRQAKFRHEEVEIELDDSCACCTGGMIGATLGRTLKTVLYLLVTMLIINITVSAIGETALSRILLSGSILQPALCALIGLIPGCAVSVLLTQLFLGGSISFGAAIAGLSTGAGFGYTLLFQDKTRRKDAWRVIGATYLVAVVGGTLLQQFFR